MRPTWIYLLQTRDGLKKPYSFGGMVMELHKIINNSDEASSVALDLRKPKPHGWTYYYDVDGVEFSVEKWTLDA